MKRIATTLLLLLLAVAVSRPAVAQECASMPEMARYRTLIARSDAFKSPVVKHDHARKMAVLSGVATSAEASRCLALAGLKPTINHRAIAADGSLTSVVGQIWAGADWSDDDRTLLSYDEGGRMNALTYQMWNGTEWENVDRELLTFDGDQEILLISQEWDGSEWVNLTRFESAYGIGSVLESFLSQIWENDAWVNLVRGSSTYDSNGNVVTTLTEIWENEAWMNGTRSTFTYDGQARVTETLLESWDETEGAWIATSRIVTEWSGDMSVATTEFGDGETWVVFSRVTTTFDGQGRTIVQVFESSNFITPDLIPQTRMSTTFDSAGNETENLTETWNGTAWVARERATATYDADNDLVEIVEQLWNGAGWDNDYRSLFNYGTPTALEDAPRGFAVSAVGLFPNPVRDRLTVDVTLDAPGHLRVEVYDLLGRRVATLSDASAPAGVQQLRWDADGKPAGLYLVRLESGGKTMTRTVALVR